MKERRICLGFTATDSRWHSIPMAGLLASQTFWLTRCGSFTEHLGALGNVTLTLIREIEARPWADEYKILNLKQTSSVFTREVLIAVDNVPFVAAHSIVSIEASHESWRSIRFLQMRSLAEILYTDHLVKRTRLVNRVITVGHPLHILAKRSRILNGTERLLARRSIFERGLCPLMVTECFLPTIWNTLAERLPVRVPIQQTLY